MGQSPKEQASQDTYGRLQGLQQRFLGGDLSGQSLNSQVTPTFDAGKDYMNQALSTRLMGVGQSIGESLMTSGVPKGAPQANLFAGAMAPAIAQNQTELSNITQRQGMTLADLLKFSLGESNQIGQQELGAIGGMKDSTTAGDVFGGLTAGSSLLSILSNPKILQMILGGNGQNTSNGGDNSQPSMFSLFPK
jgi:hypothetical protein